jgi:hypothetical protein
MRSSSRLTRLSLRSILVGCSLVFSACSGDSTGSSPQPTSIVFIGSNALTGTVGQALSSSLQIEIRDSRGATVPDVPFTVTVSSGAIAGAPAKTVVGTTSIGTWTLGTTAGAQQLTVASEGLPSLVLSAVAMPGAAAVSSTEGQPTTAQGTAGTVSPLTPQIRITDSFGNPIAGASIGVEIVGGGSVQFPSPVTNSNGFATVGTWTLGSSGGTQRVTLTPPALSPLAFTVNTGSQFNIDIRFVGGTPTAAATAAFTAAGERIRQIIAGDIPDFAMPNTDIGNQCFGAFPGGAVSMPPINETVDDIVIFARVTSIDGPGGILGVGGPCFIRTPSFLPIIGIMVFDQADANNSAFGLFVLHEMLHAVGIGTIWAPQVNPVLTQGYGTSNPIFLGAQARSQFVTLGGSTPSGVPLEGTGGSGSAGGHWRQQAFFGNELMTAFFNGAASAHPISTVTVGALADFGYAVSFAAADAFSLGGSQAALIFGDTATPLVAFGDGTLRRPAYSVDQTGQVKAIGR